MEKFFDNLSYYLALIVIPTSIFTISYVALYWTKSEQLEIQEFERNTWLKIEQLVEKYHVNRDQILDQYSSLKFNQQILRDEISNALKSHQNQ